MFNFEKIVLHNFGSYGHAELELSDRGFCLVTGKNNYKKDNALSNGSGKSFLWSAICYALTGETINGLKNNLKNINAADDPTSYVTLSMQEDSDDFLITRHIAPKSDLKIIKNGIDISGKGIRESENKLAEVLPNLSKALIASTIIVGQGMPNKFSSFSSSGRKELLERLTESDFMIEDIKARVARRQQELMTSLRSQEDLILRDQTQQKVYEGVLQRLAQNGLNKPRLNFENDLAQNQLKIASFEASLSKLLTDLQSYENELNSASTELVRLVEERANIVTEKKTAFDSITQQLFSEKTQLESELMLCNAEINRLKSIKDICPTCGQKIPGIVKPDTSGLETQAAGYTQLLKENLAKTTTSTAQYNQSVAQATAETEKAINETKSKVGVLREQINRTKSVIASTESTLSELRSENQRLQYEKDNWEAAQAQLQQEYTETKKLLSDIAERIQANYANVDNIKQHQAIVKKMESLSKRDFRGFLLSNIIKYLNKKAKEYCEIVFGTQDLQISLEGNDLNITYCQKVFDGLSGGEKQRVDLILQFAIRNMLSTYLNFSSNILVLDEITDFLDKKSCKAVFKLITEELRDTGSVFIVSHHATALDLPIDSEITICKNEDGVSEILYTK